MSVLDQLPREARVAVIRLRSLGDCVLTTPALTMLKTARPDLLVGVVVEERFRAVFEENPAINQILPATWPAIRRWQPELCVNLHGGSRSQWMTALSGAKWRAGFANHNTTLAYNVKIPRAQTVLNVQRTVHTAEHMASAFVALGVPLQDVPRAQLFSAEPPAPGRYAVIHPFASSPDKQWSSNRFCEVARYLDLWNIKPVFLGAPNDDVTPFKAHQTVRGSLKAAKALLSKATVFVGNDSGPAHMAAAFGVPSVVLFGPSNHAIWGPWQTESEIVVAPDGLREVSVSRVIAALERLRMFEEAHA